MPLCKMSTNINIDDNHAYVKKHFLFKQSQF